MSDQQPDPAPTLSICIVNHRTPELTRQCLQSIADHPPRQVYEIILVNNTQDQCLVSGILPAHIALTFIQNENALGFAANQNQMLRRAKGRYLMPLNSDTRVHPNALNTLIDFMDAHPRCGLAAPHLEYGDGQLQVTCHNFPNFLNSVIETSGLWRLFRGNALVGQVLYTCHPHNQRMQVDWLTGACLITRAEVVQHAGPYNEQQFPFMYGEDLEWAWRIKHGGWEIWFVADARVMHLESQSPVADRRVEVFRGILGFLKMHYSKMKFFNARLGMILGLALRWLLVQKPEAKRVAAQALRLYV